MPITRQRLKKLEDKTQLKYVPDEVIINYRKPDGEIVRLACHNPICVIPSNEQENIISIEGKSISVQTVLATKYGICEADKKLYEQDGFVILPDKINDNSDKD